jgi:homoserine O-acetyltransferase/O-succinyltransferase
MKSHRFTLPGAFHTETNCRVPALDLHYCTSGKFIRGISKVAWVCHALTASADCEEWWPDLIGDGKAINPDEYFIICVNIPSSCYGSTGPLSVNPETGESYFSAFPFFTVRDIVRCFIELRKHLGIDQIDLLIGGSMGGYQCMEWALMEPEVIRQLVLVATGAKESAWGIAIHTAQRIAIETDTSFGEKRDDAGARGLKAARAIGMLTYRNYEAFVRTQSDEEDKLDHFKASSYINYQGDKLVNRFNAYSYWLLTKTMDAHNVARERGELAQVLKSVKARTLCIGISSDILCPVAEQRFMADHIPQAKYVEIDSPFGHDGFLVEGEKIGQTIISWLLSEQKIR